MIAPARRSKRNVAADGAETMLSKVSMSPVTMQSGQKGRTAQD
jgi:hypothetical protein